MESSASDRYFFFSTKEKLSVFVVFIVFLQFYFSFFQSLSEKQKKKKIKKMEIFFNSFGLAIHLVCDYLSDCIRIIHALLSQ